MRRGYYTIRVALVVSLIIILLSLGYCSYRKWHELTNESEAMRDIEDQLEKLKAEYKDKTVLYKKINRNRKDIEATLLGQKSLISTMNVNIAYDKSAIKFKVDKVNILKAQLSHFEQLITITSSTNNNLIDELNYLQKAIVKLKDDIDLMKKR